MNHEKASQLEHLLLNLIQDASGKRQQRGSTYNGITIDADAFENDAAAINGLWLAVQLLQNKS
jgi:hypothetical protein